MGGAIMKLHVFLAICSQNKAAVLSVAVLLSSVVGGGCYASTPDGQSAIQSIIQPIPQAAAQAPNTEPVMTLSPSETTQARIAITTATTVPAIAEETRPAITETTPAATQAATESTTVPTTQETTQATAKSTTQAAAAPAKAKTAPTTAATTAAPAATTAAPAPAATAAAAPVSLGDSSGSYNGDMAYAILDKVNAQRSAAGLPALTWNDTLASSAKIRSTEIVVKWSHTRPDGSPWYTAGSQMEMGENLAYGQSSVQQVMDEWMASPGHAENILRGSFTQMGVACYNVNGTYYWAQHFA